MNKKNFALALCILAGIAAAAQEPDTLSASVATARQQANYLSKGKELRTEVISSQGLMKMACCNLAESFENSSSVTVGYSDAVTGARQIRLLGLSGTYTQMLDENRPVMRGLGAPFGLSLIPGPWLESIQIAKGSPSVINGVESMTGQINLEHRKPTDSKPLFLNGSIMSDTKADLNLSSSLQLSDKLSTVVLGHADGNFKRFDKNADGFADDPSLLQLSLGNRWLYYTPTWQFRWGIQGSYDRRRGGQLEGPWVSDVSNTLVNAYLKAGRSLREDGSASIALVADYSFRRMGALQGRNDYGATEHSAFGNLIYRNRFSESHDFTAGVNFTADWWEEALSARGQDFSAARTLVLQGGPYAEYTFKPGERFTLIGGVAGVYVGGGAWRVAPRMTLKYQPFEALVLRANGGRGLRRAHPVVDNFGVLATGKTLSGSFTERILEDAWTYGGNVSYYFSESTYLSADFFRTRFTNQLLANREAPTGIFLYALDGNLSYSNSFQLDFSAEPLSGLTLSLTARYTDARAWQPGLGVRQVPLVSPFKGVFNAQYKTHLSRWIFDFTASLLGPSRVYDFMKNMYPEGSTPWYPQLFAQVTRRFRGFDLYLGGENLTGFMQHTPIIGASEPFGPSFDAASVWGPLMGVKVYLGFRVTIWK